MVLLHSAEFGGCAEFSWEHNIPAIAERFHVLAPDHLGFGLTDKVHDFNGQFGRRITHIRRFLEVMCVPGPVVAIGSSMSGGLCLTVAARPRPDWPLAKVVCCSGGGDAPNNDARKTLNSYDGTKEHMRRIVDVMFVDKKWAADEAYIDRRVADGEPAGRLGGDPGRALQGAVPRRRWPAASATRSTTPTSRFRRWCSPAGTIRCASPATRTASCRKIPNANCTCSRMPATWATSNAQMSSTGEF